MQWGHAGWEPLIHSPYAASRPLGPTRLQGGVRVNAYASGGFIPAARRGTVETGFTAIEDWYTT